MVFPWNSITEWDVDEEGISFSFTYSNINNNNANQCANNPMTTVRIHTAYVSLLGRPAGLIQIHVGLELIILFVPECFPLRVLRENTRGEGASKQSANQFNISQFHLNSTRPVSAVFPILRFKMLSCFSTHSHTRRERDTRWGQCTVMNSNVLGVCVCVYLLVSWFFLSSPHFVPERYFITSFILFIIVTFGMKPGSTCALLCISTKII